MCWSRAKITKVEGSNIHVEFVNSHEKYDRVLTFGNFDIYQQGIKCRDFKWREQIRVGEELDACDSMGIWYMSTVLEKRSKRTDGCRKIQQIKVGYRYYHENGQKTDSEGKAYDGWSDRYDEWVSVTSPRVRGLNKQV